MVKKTNSEWNSASFIILRIDELNTHELKLYCLQHLYSKQIS